MSKRRFPNGLCSKGLTLDKTFNYILKLKPEDTWDGTEDLEAKIVYGNILKTSLKRNKHICISKQGIRKMLKL